MAAAGHPRRVRSLFDGYGYSRTDMTFELKRRLMALMMLHRFSDPIRHLCIDKQARDIFDIVTNPVHENAVNGSRLVRRL